MKQIIHVSGNLRRIYIPCDLNETGIGYQL